MVDSLTKQKQEMQKFQEEEMLKHLDLRYKNEIIRSMEWLAEKEDTIFLGQAVNYSGNAMYNTTKTISMGLNIANLNLQQGSNLFNMNMGVHNHKEESLQFNHHSIHGFNSKINNINIVSSSLPSGLIEIQAFPESNDVIGLKDLYLSLDISKSTINMVRDVIASGDEITGTLFVKDFYTSSYSNGNLIRK